MKQLLNKADTKGTFNGIGVDNWTDLTVELTALDIKKTADKKIWVEDELEYTITVTNMDETLPVTDITVTDKIDPIIARLVETSVKLDGSGLTIIDDFTYDQATGELIILPTTIPELLAGESCEITFQVIFAQP